jgi:hypothetical protein
MKSGEEWRSGLLLCVCGRKRASVDRLSAFQKVFGANARNGLDVKKSNHQEEAKGRS